MGSTDMDGYMNILVLLCSEEKLMNLITSLIAVCSLSKDYPGKHEESLQVSSQEKMF